MDMTDTIVAVSTAAGESPRAIVRLSGPKALALAEALMAGPGVLPREGYRVYAARIAMDGLLVPAQVYVMPAPASYTREDVVEIHAFGNPHLTEALLAELIRRGARAAGPGEFTRRAFLNGRLDLAQAESVEALIRARSESEYRAALETLSGRLSGRIAALRDRLADLAALVEVSLDFSDQDVEIISPEEARERLQPLRVEMAALLNGRGEGRVTQGAARVALCGPPNAGKSSLFNALLERPRAIISPVAGTTRDTLEARCRIGEADLLLVDTAGIRGTQDDIERLAVDRARGAMDAAALRLFVLDSSAAPNPDTTETLAAYDAAHDLLLLNKCDLGPCHPGLAALIPEKAERLAVSALTGEGIGAVRARVRAYVEQGRVDRAAGGLMVNARQRDLMGRAAAALDRAAAPEPNGMDLLAQDLREALQALADLLGGEVAEDVLDRIFSRFCIGK